MKHSPDKSNQQAVSARHWLGPLLIALTAFCWIGSHLDPAGDYPQSPAGPGLVVDEIFYVSHGESQLDKLLNGDLAGYRKVVDELPDHPPVGKLWLGMWNDLGLVFFPPSGPHTHLIVGAARLGGASAFAILVFLSGWCASRWYSITTGWWVSAALCAMPRLWGQAHLAVIEMPIVEIPKDWIEISEGGMKFRLHPDLKRLDAPELAGKGLLVFTGDRERKIIVSEPDELLDIKSIQGLQKLGDDVRGVSLPRLKIRAYQVSSRDFRWSMSPEEMRKHFDSLRLSRYLRFSSTERLESLLGTELDGLLHVELKSSSKSFDWESKEQSRERFG
ncbi:MAG: hypothetical protein KDA36_02115, partial [Planctomycetaceae bacterium]|nr:hypothetical protein [Planctomycetaceae bacterium]